MANNFFIPRNFSLAIPEKPLLEKMVKRVSLPSISVSVPQESVSRYSRRLTQPDTIQYSTFSIAFYVDEDFKVYETLLEWLESYIKGYTLPVDITYIGLDSNKRQIFTLIFERCYPSELPSFTSDYSEGEEPLEIEVQFEFQRLRLKR